MADNANQEMLAFAVSVQATLNTEGLKTDFSKSMVALQNDIDKMPLKINRFQFIAKSNTGKGYMDQMALMRKSIQDSPIPIEIRLSSMRAADVTSLKQSVQLLLNGFEALSRTPEKLSANLNRIKAEVASIATALDIPTTAAMDFNTVLGDTLGLYTAIAEQSALIKPPGKGRGRKPAGEEQAPAPAPAPEKPTAALRRGAEIFNRALMGEGTAKKPAYQGNIIADLDAVRLVVARVVSAGQKFENREDLLAAKGRGIAPTAKQEAAIIRVDEFLKSTGSKYFNKGLTPVTAKTFPEFLGSPEGQVKFAKLSMSNPKLDAKGMEALQQKLLSVFTTYNEFFTIFERNFLPEYNRLMANRANSTVKSIPFMASGAAKAGGLQGILKTLQASVTGNTPRKLREILENPESRIRASREDGASYDYMRNRVSIGKDLSETDKATALVHELGHAAGIRPRLAGGTKSVLAGELINEIQTAMTMQRVTGKSLPALGAQGFGSGYYAQGGLEQSAYFKDVAMITKEMSKAGMALDITDARSLKAYLQVIAQNAGKLSFVQKGLTSAKDVMESVQRDLGTGTLGRFQESRVGNVPYNAGGNIGGAAQRESKAKQDALKEQVGLDSTGKESAARVSRLQLSFRRLMSYALSASVIYGATTAMREMGKSVIEVDNNMRELNKTLQVNDSDLGKTRDSILDIAFAYGQVASQTVKMAEQWAKQGFRGEELSSLTEKTSMLTNVAEDISPEEAVKVTTAALKQYSMSLSESSALMDKWVKLSQTQRVSVDDLANGFAQVGALAKNAGLGIDELNALLATTTAVSDETGENVANAFRSIFSRLTEPIPKTKQAFADVGINLEQYIGDMPALLTEISSKWQGWNAEQRQGVAIAAAEKRRAAVFFDLMRAMEDATGYQQALNDSQNASGALTKANTERMKSFEMQLKQLKAAFAELAVMIADTGMLTMFTGIVSGIGNVVHALSGAQGVTKLILGWAAALGAVRIAAEQLVMMGGLSMIGGSRIGKTGLGQGLAGALSFVAGSGAIEKHAAMEAHEAGRGSKKGKAIIEEAIDAGEGVVHSLPYNVRSRQGRRAQREQWQRVAAHTISPAEIAMQGAFDMTTIHPEAEILSLLDEGTPTYKGYERLKGGTKKGGKPFTGGVLQDLLYQTGLYAHPEIVAAREAAKKAGKGKNAKEVGETAQRVAGGMVDAYETAFLAGVEKEDREARTRLLSAMKGTVGIKGHREERAVRQNMMKYTGMEVAQLLSETGGTEWTNKRTKATMLARAGLKGVTADSSSAEIKVAAEKAQKYARNMWSGVGTLMMNQQTWYQKLGNVFSAKDDLGQTKFKKLLTSFWSGLNGLFIAIGKGIANAVRGIGQIFVGTAQGTETKQMIIGGLATAGLVLVGLLVGWFKKSQAEADAQVAATEDWKTKIEEYADLRTRVAGGTGTQEDRTRLSELSFELARQFPQAVDKIDRLMQYVDINQQEALGTNTQNAQRTGGPLGWNDWRMGGGQIVDPTTGLPLSITSKNAADALTNQTKAIEENSKYLQNTYEGAKGQVEAIDALRQAVPAETFAQILKDSTQRGGYVEGITRPLAAGTTPFNTQQQTQLMGYSRSWNELMRTIAPRQGALNQPEVTPEQSEAAQQALESLRVALMETKGTTAAASAEMVASAWQKATDEFPKAEDGELWQARFEQILDAENAKAAIVESFNEAMAESTGKLEAQAAALENLTSLLSGFDWYQGKTLPEMGKGQFGLMSSLLPLQEYNANVGYNEFMVNPKTNPIQLIDDYAAELGTAVAGVSTKKELETLLTQSLPQKFADVSTSVSNFLTAFNQVLAVATQRILEQVQTAKYSQGLPQQVMYESIGMKAGTGAAQASRTGNQSAFSEAIKLANAYASQGKPDEAAVAWQQARSAFEAYVSVEADIANQASENQSKEKALRDKQKQLWETWFSANREYLSFLVDTDQATASQAYLVTQKLRGMAKTPQDQMSLDKELFDMRKQIYEERLSGAESWLQHETSMERVSLPTQIKTWEQILQLAKDTKNKDWIWKAEEEIFRLKKEQADKAKAQLGDTSNNLAKDIFKRAAGSTGPLSIGIAEYRAALQDSNSDLEDEAKDAGDVLGNLGKYMKDEFGGMSKSITGSTDDIMKKTDTYADAVAALSKEEDVAATATNGLSSAAQTMGTKLGEVQALINESTNPAFDSIKDSIGGFTKLADEAAKSAPEFQKEVQSVSDLIGYLTGLGASGQLAGSLARLDKRDKTDSWGVGYSPIKSLKDSILGTQHGTMYDAFIQALRQAKKENIFSMLGGLFGGGQDGMPSVGKGTMAIPVPGGTYSDTWGASRGGGRRTHKGTDIFAPRGTPVLSVSDGVASTSTNSLGGNSVNVSSGDSRFYYAHLDRWAFTGRRQVSKGDLLGFVGNTGNAINTPPHLHFQMDRGGGWTNPYPYLKLQKFHKGNLNLDERLAVYQTGETIVSRQDTPILMSILDNIGKLKSAPQAASATGTVFDLTLNLTLPDGSTRTIKEKVVGITDTKLALDRRV